MAPVQTQYQYPPQQDFQPVEPEVRKERYEDRSQERQYNSADFSEYRDEDRIGRIHDEDTGSKSMLVHFGARDQTLL